ncbi:hypothetical protein CK203_077558 [Vitis vinifera]|uniref:C-JID domain-containing protein n=1 Tax=Vitis vinifera TaxID=29760 RepID=A0A438DTC9_VITVI|nr:hypothetical protein CK203_077558 [Vitis vinifera]
MIGGLQGEEWKFIQKYPKEKISCGVGRNRGKFAPRKGVRNFRTPEEGVRTSHTIRTAKGGCAKFSHTWSSCLPKAISSSFQLQIMHGLKRWILDFLSFEMDSKRTSFSDSSYHGKGTCIVLPGSDGIPEWIMHLRNRPFLITELPQIWHQNNEFLGFAICCVYVPLADESEDKPKKESAHGPENESDNKSEDESTHTWKNETDDKSVAESSHKDEDNESVSDQTWVVCYSKVAILEMFRSYQRTDIVPVFHGFDINSEKAVKVKECGVRLIYSQDLQQSHPLTTQTEGADVRLCIRCQRDGALRRKRCFEGSDMNELSKLQEIARQLGETTIFTSSFWAFRFNEFSIAVFVRFMLLEDIRDSSCNLREFPSEIYYLSSLGREFALVTAFIAESIPEWISHQKSGLKITMKLPWSWYENDDFLGFVLCSLYVPLEIETTTRRGFNCQLNFDDDTAYFSYESIQFCEFCYDGDASSQGCLIYYPKSRFPKRYHSNEWKTLNASFNAYFEVSCDTSSAVEDTNTDVERSCDGTTLHIDGNGVDAQDHEMDHMHRWLELLCKFVHWICCTRH